jgi:hypothetical protein
MPDPGYGAGYAPQPGFPQQQQQQQQVYPQQPVQQPVAPEDETAGWDYRSYYNQGGSAGFNWWEQS